MYGKLIFFKNQVLGDTFFPDYNKNNMVKMTRFTNIKYIVLQ